MGYTESAVETHISVPCKSTARASEDEIICARCPVPMTHCFIGNEGGDDVVVPPVWARGDGIGVEEWLASLNGTAAQQTGS